MELILERGLAHQQKAVDAVVSVLDGATITKPHMAYENPTFDRADEQINNKILNLQKGIRVDHRGCLDKGNYLSLDVKMETGTGKTYVYTQ